MYVGLRLGGRLAALGCAAGLVAAACGRAGQEPGAEGGSPPVALERIASTPREEVPSALQNPASPDLPDPLVDPAEIIPGGPPPDGIPPLDEPLFHPASDVDWLEDREAVVAIRVGEDARAYPVQILMWHEIVNDAVGGLPVTVSYCPLCNTAIAYDRRLGRRILDFGTSGKLYHSALVMYDRQTESLWSHFTGRAVAGVLTGEGLDLIPVNTVSWGDWRRANPGAWVLSRQTGFRRSYGDNPYVAYDRPESVPFLFRGDPDARLPPKTRLIGIRHEGAAAAVLLEPLLEKRVIQTTLGETRIVIWVKPGTASALDAPSVSGGRDVGTTGVFEATLDGVALNFEVAGDSFRDVETGTTWDVLGAGASGPLKDRRLVPVEHVDTFWFAWVAFMPESRILK